LAPARPLARLPAAQRDPSVRRFLLRWHVPTLVQLAIIAYVASGWQYFRKVPFLALASGALPLLAGPPKDSQCLQSQGSQLSIVPNRLFSSHLPAFTPSSQHAALLVCAQARQLFTVVSRSPSFPLPLLQSLSYASPKALLNALLPQGQLPASASDAADGGRVAAFKRYIAGVLRGWVGRKGAIRAAGAALGRSSTHSLLPLLSVLFTWPPPFFLPADMEKRGGSQTLDGYPISPPLLPCLSPPADMEKRGGGQAVPEFPSGLAWLNAPPLKLSRELRGKVVLLDFWTYCW